MWGPAWAFPFVFLFMGAVPLLPLCLRPLERHRNAWVRGIAKLAVWALLWLTFDWSLMATWGAFRFVPEWWAWLIVVTLLQICRNRPMTLANAHDVPGNAVCWQMCEGP